jgi:hypothetical protein
VKALRNKEMHCSPAEDRSPAPAPAPAPAPVIVNTDRASAQYYADVLRIVCQQLGWQNTVGPPSIGTAVVWSEDPTRKPRLLALPAGTRTNRFFAMVRVCRKCCLAICLNAYERVFPEHFSSLSPRSWWVGTAGWEGQLTAHRVHAAAVDGGSFGAYIVKPDNGCQGANIVLVRSHEELLALLARPDSPQRAVVQTYLANPLLLDGLKFDLRLYVIMTCASPLQAFLSTRGVARFASHPWKPVDASNQARAKNSPRKNPRIPTSMPPFDPWPGSRADGGVHPQEDRLMHLSNSSINQTASGVTNKWELPRLWARLSADGCDTDALWAAIHRLVALTLVSVQPAIAHAYTTAFYAGSMPSRRTKLSAASRAAGRPTHGAPSPASEITAQGQGESECAIGIGGSAPADGGKNNCEHPLVSGKVADEARPEARRCFQILGFDVMLDSEYKPWLIEVSRAPCPSTRGLFLAPISLVREQTPSEPAGLKRACLNSRYLISDVPPGIPRLLTDESFAIHGVGRQRGGGM